MRIQTIRSRRAGFTMVELLVVMALISLIMSLLSQAFVEGLATVRNLKGIGDMQENLRTAIVPLRNDLGQRHFQGSEKLSISYEDFSRPARGFFRVQQGVPHGALIEGIDSDGIPSYRVITDILHMTTASVGPRRSDYLTADVPPAVNGGTTPNPNPSRWLWTEGPNDYRASVAMISQWSEVMWFLSPMIDPDTKLPMTAGPSLTPLFNLHRRQKLLVLNNFTTLNTIDRIDSTNLANFTDIACKPDPSAVAKLYFSPPSDMAVVPPGFSGPPFRSMADNAGTCLPQTLGSVNASRIGEDRVIADVISFEIKVLVPGAFTFMDISTAQAFLGIAPTGVYDTATWPTKLTIRSVQIVLRVWDAKTEQTRQMTLIQDM